MEWFEAVILGLVQGLTEFLPVSSSGHLEIGKALLGVETTDDLLFTTMVPFERILLRPERSEGGEGRAGM